MSWNNPIMPLVVVDSTGSASYSNIASAIMYAADHGVRVMNISLAGSSPSSTVQSAINYAWNKGSVAFVSAGNYSTSTPYYPAACDNAVAVSATDSTDLLASFSNFGSWVDLAAPGVSILTTSSGGSYGYWSGTSFSAPVAAGVAALVLAVKPSMSASILVSTLEQNADDLGAPGFDTSFGYGRVNAYRSVVAAQSAPTTTPPVVSISNPSNSSTVSGSVQVQGTATDTLSMTNIQLSLDGQPVASSSTSPFAFTWNMASVANGSHTLTVSATDTAGNTGSSSIAVTVNNLVVIDTQPPTVVITKPSNGALVSGNVTIAVSATDNVAVSQVSIYIDGILRDTGTSAPYSYNWNTRKASAGTHTIKATAWDAAGNFASATVTVSK